MLPIVAVYSELYTFLAAALAPVPVLSAGHNETFPYLTLGPVGGGGQNDTLNEQATDFNVLLQAYSRQPGYLEIGELLEKTEAAVSRKKFPLPNGQQWVDTIFDDVQMFDELDGVTRRGVLRFRILTFKP
jgi:uncharacterized protein DUF3168